ncbi:HlyD family efflux transporter periplasmic adaptor subunit [Oricola thermophila]|uniref:HlyD family efflux transporter periplasmic adaptor subunit n=1 Tax=Oricola thermophila TaxID=2742145 RepID=UPI001AEEAA18|nr:HlyD family secretion protein [Oricola thermophila]
MAKLESLLREHVDTEKERKTKDPAAPGAPPPSRLRSRLIKTGIGVVLIAVAGWMPAQRLFQVQSVEAVINAPLVTIRAPISGVVSGEIAVGDAIEPGASLVRVSNPRMDDFRLADALKELDEAREERDALAARLVSLGSLRADLSVKLDAFRVNRLRQIEAQIAEADARIAAADAVVANAGSVQERSAMLQEKGIVAQNSLGEADRDAAVAKATAAEARAARTALLVERDALAAGIYVGDSYNDQPRTAQRIDEIDEQIANSEAGVKRQESRIARAEAAVAREREAFELVSAAELASPVAGRVWEVLTAPGEQVAAGQDLFRLLNCSQAIVTAVVTEAVYNSLSTGMPARFIYREGGDAVAGKVVQLSGVATASSNFAILPSALQKESYRVTVALDTAGSANDCAVGRTGRVVFGGTGA